MLTDALFRQAEDIPVRRSIAAWSPTGNRRARRRRAHPALPRDRRSAPLAPRDRLGGPAHRQPRRRIGAFRSAPAGRLQALLPQPQLEVVPADYAGHAGAAAAPDQLPALAGADDRQLVWFVLAFLAATSPAAPGREIDQQPVPARTCRPNSDCTPRRRREAALVT